MATELQKAVWEKLKEIPEGRVTTYALLAKVVGKPKAVRAVASAVGKNPDLVVVPCHRVVRSDGSVGQYAGGQDEKIKLLNKERVPVSSHNKINLQEHIFAFM